MMLIQKQLVNELQLVAEKHYDRPPPPTFIFIYVSIINMCKDMTECM